MQTTMQFIGGPINRTVQFEQCKKLPETDDLDIIAAWSIYTLTNNGTVGLATDKLSLNYIYKIEHQENKNGVFVKAESFLRLFVQPRDFLCKSHLLCKAHVGYA